MDDRGTVSLLAAATIAFSGNLLPLPLFPDWMHAFLFVQPFASLIDIPFRLYLGQLSGEAALAGLAVQAFWAAALMLVGRALTEGVMRRLQVQGG
jgi:ABC-2 type transport system permease protein